MSSQNKRTVLQQDLSLLKGQAIQIIEYYKMDTIVDVFFRNKRIFPCADNRKVSQFIELKSIHAYFEKADLTWQTRTTKFMQIDSLKLPPLTTIKKSLLLATFLSQSKLSTCSHSF